MIARLSAEVSKECRSRLSADLGPSLNPKSLLDWAHVSAGYRISPGGNSDLRFISAGIRKRAVKVSLFKRPEPARGPSISIVKW